MALPRKDNDSNAEIVFNRAFNGDSFMPVKIAGLCKRFGIQNIVETGTFCGASTKEFAQMMRNTGQRVYTIESNDQSYRELTEFDFDPKLDDMPHVTRIHGESQHVLQWLIPKLQGPSLFFLDAHWDENPLLAELAAIAAHGILPVILIHDFKVPDHPEWGFDSYPVPDGNGGERMQDYEFSWVKPSLDAIYGPNGYHHEFNDEANGDFLRGCLYVTPE